MSDRWKKWWAAAAVLAAGAASAEAQTETPGECDTIAAIEVRGNQRMSADAVRFDLGIKPGDRWDEAAVRREFRRFWDRGLFSDLRFFRRCTPAGATLIVEVRERPQILSITYEKNTVASQQQIEDYYKKKNFTLTVGSTLDRKKLYRAVSLIKEVLGQKGYLDAEVRPEIKEVSPTARNVHFRIQTGGKTRIRAINFSGNESFSDAKLRSQFKMTQPWKFYWPWSPKYLYHPLKYQQDVTNVRQFYLDRGYLDADVSPPVVEVKSVRPAAKAGRAPARSEREARREERKRRKAGVAAGEAPVAALSEESLPKAPRVKERKWVYLTVPVKEGEIYRLGEVRFQGNTVFPVETLRGAVPLQNGNILSDAVLEAGVNNIRAMYGRKGYVYAAVTRSFQRQEGKAVADVLLDIDEDQAYTVRRIEFTGNTSTHDEVLRREMNIHEGELLNRAMLDRSVQKLQMLGFWVPGGEPELRPVPEKAQVDVLVHGEEQSRNEINVGGGYSGLEGGFFLASYDTRNFFGRGEDLGLYLAIGGRYNQASINFTERWFLGKPYTFGFSIYRRSYDFGLAQDASGSTQRLNQKATGGQFTLGKRFGDFTLVQLSYGYETTTADTLDLSSTFSTSKTSTGWLTPYFSYRRVNNYLRPTRGFQFEFVPQIATRALGGDNNFIRPRVESSVYIPLFHPAFLAVHGEFAWIRQFGDLRREAGFVDGVPRFQRFFLGGDYLGPRVFETRSLSPTRYIVPIDENGNPQTDIYGNPVVVKAYVGGSKMALLQFELGFPIGRTATLAGFLDIGGVYDNGVDIGSEGARVSSGLEFRVYLPVFQAPIRLIYGWPLRKEEGDRTNQFQFSIGLPF